MDTSPPKRIPHKPKRVQGKLSKPPHTRNRTQERLIKLINKGIDTPKPHEKNPALESMRHLLFAKSMCDKPDCAREPKTIKDVKERHFCPTCLRPLCHHSVLWRNSSEQYFHCKGYFSVDDAKLEKTPALAIALKELSYKCKECDYETLDYEEYGEHFMTCPVKESLCNICKKNVKDIWGHIGGKHTSEEYMTKIHDSKRGFKKSSKTLDAAQYHKDLGFEKCGLRNHKFGPFEKNLLEHYKIDGGCVIGECNHSNRGKKRKDDWKLYRCEGCKKITCEGCNSKVKINKGQCALCRGYLNRIPDLISRLLVKLVAAKCPRCDATFLEERHFEEHVHTCDGGWLQCFACEEFFTHRGLRAHVGMCHTSLETVVLMEG